MLVTSDYSHMTGTKSLFNRLSKLSDIRSVVIANGRTCPVSGEGVVHASSQITFDNVLYVPEFPVNLLSINKTTTLLCNILPLSLYLSESTDGEEDWFGP